MKKKWPNIYDLLMEINHFLLFFSPDPSLTVRADITGRYSNRLYAYEPSDIALCKYSVLLFTAFSVEQREIHYSTEGQRSTVVQLQWEPVI